MTDNYDYEICKAVCGKVLQFRNKTHKPNFNRLLKSGDMTNLTIQLANLYTKEVQKRQLKNAGGGGSSEELEILTDQIEEYKNAVNRSKEHIGKMKAKIKRFVEERKGYESVIDDIKMREEKMSDELKKFKDKLKQAERIMWENRKNIDYEFEFYGDGDWDMTPDMEDLEDDELNYWDKPAGVQQGGSSEVKRWSKEFATEEEENEYYSEENMAKRYAEQVAKTTD
jgi:archaellum component FlaC